MGAGISPAGLFPAGIGLPVTSTAVAAAGYGLSTTGAVSSVLIDRVTHDFEYDSYGNETGMADTEQRVANCLRTIRGSVISSQLFGFKAPSKITSQVQREVYEAVRLALQPVTSDGSAELISVEVEQSGATSIAALVTWRDSVSDARPQTTRQTL